MVNYKAKKGSTKLGSFVSSGTGTTTTITLTSSVDFGTYSAIEIYLDCSSTAALQLGMRINADSGGTYQNDGRTIIGGTEALINTTETQFIVAPTELLAGADYAITSHIILQNSIEDNFPSVIITTSGNSGLAANAQYSGLKGVALHPITSLTFLVTTSSWKTLRVSVYGVLR